MIPRSLSGARFRFAVPFGKFALAIVSLPFLSFIFCVVWCVLYFYERSTSTHCNVANYLPSISAAIGNYQPQRFVWQTAIIVHAIPRFLIAHQYLKYNKSRVKRTRYRWVYCTFIINVIEVIALVGLSVFNSSEYYEAHKTWFIVFIVMSELYMVLSCCLIRYSPKMFETLGRAEKRSFYLKRVFCTINIAGILFACHFFKRHNEYCEPGVYTIFAMMEYVVVLSNMAFHMTAYWDFHDGVFVCDWRNGFDLIASNQYTRLV